MMAHQIHFMTSNMAGIITEQLTKGNPVHMCNWVNLNKDGVPIGLSQYIKCHIYSIMNKTILCRHYVRIILTMCEHAMGDPLEAVRGTLKRMRTFNLNQ